MKDDRVKKTVSIAVIALFIGLATAPSISAQVNKTTARNDLVEFTTDIYGINGVESQTVKLTKQQTNEIEHIFDSIKAQVDNAQSREKIIKIFSQGIEELNKYGLLPKGINVKQAERLICGPVFQYSIKNLFTNNLGNHHICNDTNTNCLFVANLNESRYLRNHVSLIVLFLFYFDSDILQKYFPFALGGTLFFGRNVTRGDFVFEHPSYGWITTIGVNGKKNWSGPFYGNISFNGYTNDVETVILYSGVTNFIGLKLRYSKEGGKQFYLGFASQVAICSSVPEVP